MLKKKFGIVTLVCLLCLCVAVLFTACGGTQGEKGDKGESGTDGKDGVSIVSVEKTDSKGLTDTYTITFSDGSKTTFTVTNGKDGVDGSDGEDGTDGETPYIGENGNWWIGSTDTKIPAKGQDGTDGSDGSDGQDGITPHIGENGNWFIGDQDTGIPAKGQNGSDGKDGISITKVDINENGELVISFSGGDSVNLGKVVGADGQDGTDGKNGISIKGATVDENGNLILTFSDDTTITAGKVKGESGVDGKDGVSVSGVEINESGELVISFSEGSPVNLGKIVGANGKDGVGIANIELDEEYNLTIYLTEGEPIKLGCIRGEKGEAGQDGSDGQDGKDGKSAYELYKEKFGYDGSEEQWLIDLVNGNLAIVQTHTVTFDAAGGYPVPQKQEVKHLGKAVKPETPIKAGYNFDGWYCGDEKWAFSGYIVTEDITLVAKWTNAEEEQSCAITSADGFEFGSEEVNGQTVQTISKKVGNNVTSYDLYPLIKVSNGCTWALYADYDLQEDTNNVMRNLHDGNNEAWIIVSSSAERTRYKVNLYRRHIRNYTFMDEEQVHDSGTIEEDSSIKNAPEISPKKAGYTFQYWTVNGEQVTFPYTVIVDTEFKAVFTPNENTLRFDGNDATGGTMENMMIATDETTTLIPNGFEKAGYHFIGWATSKENADNHIVDYKNEVLYTMGTNSDYTLYAVWKANTNTLHFNGNGATSGTMEDMTIATDTTATLIPNGFEKTGYHFIGWATSADGDVEFENEDSYPMKTESEYTLYAVWEANIYTITYNTDGGTWEQGSNPSTFTIEDLPVNLTFEPVIKNDHAFFGWYTEENFSGEAITEFTIKNIGDITFYVKFVAGTEGLQYVEENGGYTVSQYSGSETEIVIPDFHADKPVLSIQGQNYSNPVFVNGINSITFGINTQLTSIGNYAFKGCSNLTNIEIPSGVTSIGDSAFDGCSSLTSIEIPSGVTYIGRNAFDDCSSLTSIEIPSGVTSIGDSAFDGCSNLTNIEIPSGVTSIGSHMFAWCDSLTSVVFGENSQLTSIGESAFYGCSSLTSVIFGENSQLEYIQEWAFYDCSSLTSIAIPSGVTYIGRNAFDGCSSLTSVVFGENSQLPSIGDYAFMDCSGLTSIEIPSGVTSIGNYAFEGCSGLESIIVEEGNTVYISENNCLIKIANNTLILGCKNSIIPDYVTTIGYSAFDGCSSLTSIEIPSGVTTIGYSAFRDCSSLTSVVFGENSQLTSIGESVFSGCSSLTSIEIPSGVTFIGDHAFDGCSSLTSVVFGENSQLTSIGESVFSGCSSLTSIEIPSGVTSIGGGAFYDCSSLTSIEIPSSVTFIGDHAFYGCSSLTSVIFEENSQLTSIGNKAFYNCSNLTSIEIPNSVTSIGNSAFDGCNSLDIVYYGGASQSDWDEISIGYYNTYLTSATRYHYSENKPPLNEDGTTYDGNYWRYVDGVPTIWEKEQ